MVVNYEFDYPKEKDAILRQTRGVGFEDVIEAVGKGKTIDDIDHFNKRRYPNQRILIVNINNYAYAVPYVIDHEREVRFLKTIYANRVLVKKYLKRR